MPDMTSWNGKVVGRFKINIWTDNPSFPVTLGEAARHHDLPMSLSVEDVDDLLYILTQAQRALKL